jgi:hypothetical protein
MGYAAGNTPITLTGNNFVPGVAATWNGSFRTTTIVDATHLTVAIPASDLTAAGQGSQGGIIKLVHNRRVIPRLGQVTNP